MVIFPPQFHSCLDKDKSFSLLHLSQAEVTYLGQLHHPNLVKLIGFCIEDDKRLLVYEFLQRGSLENHLFRSRYFIVKFISVEKPFVWSDSWSTCSMLGVEISIDCIDAEGAPALSWNMRMKIALGAAKGVEFLHTRERPIIYRDFKTSNILLDGVCYNKPYVSSLTIFKHSEKRS